MTNSKLVHYVVQLDKFIFNLLQSVVYDIQNVSKLVQNDYFLIKAFFSFFSICLRLPVVPTPHFKDQKVLSMLDLWILNIVDYQI